MKIEQVKKAAVIGAGNMGAQIAELLSRLGGYEVRIADISQEYIDKGLHFIYDDLEQYYVAKGKISPGQRNDIMGRIKGSTNVGDAVTDADFVIEAIIEDLSLKKKVFKTLDENAPAHAILASNTSFQNISEIALATGRPDKVVGVHFFNPVAVMRLVEVVKGTRTSEETVDVACSLAVKLGKEPLVCRDTSYGFLVNRAYGAMVSEAVQMVWERVAPPEVIDKALKLGQNLPVGPLENMDAVGAWSLWASSEQDKMREVGPEKGHLHPLIRAMMRAGYMGGPGKKGIYDFWKDVLSR